MWAVVKAIYTKASPFLRMLTIAVALFLSIMFVGTFTLLAFSGRPVEAPFGIKVGEYRDRKTVKCESLSKSRIESIIALWQVPLSETSSRIKSQQTMQSLAREAILRARISNSGSAVTDQTRIILEESTAIIADAKRQIERLEIQYDEDKKTMLAQVKEELDACK